MKSHFKLNAISAALICTFVSGISVAEENTDEKKKVDKKESDVEVITVTGFRGSLQRAMNNKRFSEGVTDSIHAEDVGKSTDQNIADALSRVTGVTVQESNGEGTKISVRGANSNLNNISMNGVTLTSGLSGSGSNASAEQGVDLSSFSSDILSSIEVQKTASADQDEGSLGANVVLKTIKPLSLKKPIRSIELQGRYNDYSEDANRKVSASFSDKYLDDSLGVIFTFADETQSTRRDEYSASWDDEIHSAKAGKARDFSTGQIITEESEFLSQSSQSYGLNLDKQDRQSITLGLQYQPTADTDIQLDLTHSNQEVILDNHQYDLQILSNLKNKNSDPQEDWWTINNENHTLVKRLDRSNRGRVFRLKGGSEIKNNIGTLSIDHHFTDNFSGKLIAGYSKTSQDSLPNARVMLAGKSKTNKLPITSNDPNEVTLQPQGYDCSSGSCQIIANKGFIQFPDGITDPSFGLAPGRTNPLDIQNFRVGNVSNDEDHNSDTNKSLFLDFDWNVDYLGVTKVEFGGKYSKRVKDVYSLTTKILNNSVVVDANGDELSIGGLTDITMADLLVSNDFPVNNFMDGIADPNQVHFLDGWGIVDPFKALALATDSESGLDVKPQPDESASRIIEQEVNALYGKINFEYFDGRLTGNLGLRYVKTETNAEAFNKVQFQKTPILYDFYDLIYNRGLANGNLPVCDFEPQYPNDDVTQTPSNLPASGSCAAWQLMYNYDMNDPSTFPDFVNRDGDTYLAPSALNSSNPNYILQVVYNDDGSVQHVLNNGVSSLDGRSTENPDLAAWLDRSTIDEFIDPVTGQPLGFKAGLRSKRAKGSASNDIFLPSLNLNYKFSDDFIGRFSVSKTMSRPTFDSTTPGANIDEKYVSAWGIGKANNVALKPLESTNLDLSFEWYFNNSGLVSVAFFHKDMTNFEENITETYIWKDIRTDYDLSSVDSIYDVLVEPTLKEDADGNPIPDTQNAQLNQYEETPGTPLDESGNTCMPDRVAHIELQDSLTANCHTVKLATVRNGKGATTQGIEVNYTQNYDFLPGALSGLGLSVNYTYAESEKDIEVSAVSGVSITPLPQAYTPKHSANTTVFWEKDDLMLRLAHRYSSVQLVNDNFAFGQGVAWLDSTSKLDFSSTYKINDHFTLSFQALNLTDETNRTFLTSRNYIIDGEVYDEGNALNNSVDTSRTISEYRTGRQYRIGIRASF
ncbi:TonB-dependent receptor [Pseudoalteromonas sp. SWYJ118]|uniref:TonB-dependent receptor n=1 Tax=Pseudoalteromonas sp. SWYJ118 TaxID=2792062 RepID=UPI0018CFE71E|nr:TonB-dependent receptor [Pseudoalteromonas sp. SWYJ118]MBH0077009.1 TonB-dependent receptor [Pseudoalteromonas sp. SWYJ118]